MKVSEYIKKHNKKTLSGGGCPIVFYKDDPILRKMAIECCESSQKGDCHKHFLDAELGDLETQPKLRKN